MTQRIAQAAEPVRLQLSRKKGFDLQAWSREVNGLHALKADRATKLGNPFAVTRATATTCGKTEDTWVVGSWDGPVMWMRSTKAEAVDISVRAFRAWAAKPENAPILARAKGFNLACWCALPKLGERDVCHAATLIELANAPPAQAAEDGGRG